MPILRPVFHRRISEIEKKKFSVSGTVADLSTTNPEIKVSNPATGQLNEGKSAASFCGHVAAWVPDMFYNFYLVINDKIINNSTRHDRVCLEIFVKRDDI